MRTQEDMYFTLLAQAGQPMPPMMLVGYMAILVLIMYFLMIRPQQRREKERRSMQDTVKKGNRVVFANGIIGQVAGIKQSETEDVVIVKIADGVKIEIYRGAIQSVVEKGQSVKEAVEKSV